MRARNRDGSVVLDKRIRTWNFFWWENGKRRSKKIGTVSQYPTKASAWRAAKALRHSLENQTKVSSNAPMVLTLVEQYRAEKIPRRVMTRQGYNTWLNQYIIPTWIIGHISSHTFRHTHRSWLDEVGTPVGVQQRLMRHTDISTTMNVYGTAAPADMRQAHGKIVHSHCRGCERQVIRQVRLVSD